MPCLGTSIVAHLNVFLQLLGVLEPPVAGAAVGDEPGHGPRLVGREVPALFLLQDGVGGRKSREVRLQGFPTFFFHFAWQPETTQTTGAILAKFTIPIIPP